MPTRPKHPTCGRCGVYKYLHPTPECAKPRRSFWWDRHHFVRHLAGVAWLALSDRQRLAIIHRLHDRSPHLCWCEFVDSALLDLSKEDYRGDNGCGCNVPLPINVGLPRPGWCYCQPTALTDEEV